MVATVETLLSEIRYFREKINDYISLKQEHQMYHKNPLAGFSIWKRILTFFIINVISSMMIENSFVGLALFGATIYFLFIWPRTYVKGKLVKNHDRIIEIEGMIKVIESQLEPTYIPKSI